ncbi:MAG TPA: ABC transporter permease [Candidatus Angelobacter sp.]|nr:ABC transporter permease [Candidatus Angelobacter sp.]
MSLSRFLRRRKEDADLARELNAHILHEVDENLASGMSPDEARRQACLKLGSTSQVREAVWNWNTVGFFDSLLRDLRYAFRMIRRAPGFSVLAILCLTLGIGSSAAVLSWMEGIALRPFPAVAHQERLVAVSGTNITDKSGEKGNPDVSWPDWLDFQRSCKLFDAFIADRIMGSSINIGDRAQIMTGSVVSANYFDALGVRPILGRGFQPGEDSGRNAHPVTVISHWLWQQHFHGDPQIIGKTQMLNNVPHTIVGVAPEGFYGTFVGYAFQFWVPASMQEIFVPGGYKLEDRGDPWVEGFARLKPGVTIEQAQQEISAVASRLEKDYLATNRGRGVKLNPLWRTPFNQAGNLFPTLEIALAVVSLVLLIACANVSSLLMVKSLARRHEITVRLALGAGRGRLVKQLLVEGLVLSTIAAVAGLVVGYWCRNALIPLFSNRGGGLIINLRGEMDWRVFVWSAGISLLATLLFALFPAFHTGKFDLASSLKSESGSVFGGAGKSRVRAGLVVLQVSLSFILLVGAVLLIQSVRQIRTADPGFSTDNILLTGVGLRSAGYDAQHARIFQDALLDRVQALPGVQSAAWARVAPFSYAGYFSAPITVEGYLPAPNEQPEAMYNQVSPGYFATMAIPLLSGRDFTRFDNETAPPVAIVNEKMVSQYWHGVDPVGKRFQVKGQWTQVVGVARTSKYMTFQESPKPFFYVPLRQNYSIGQSIHIRTSRDAGSIAADVAREVRALDANLAPFEVETMRAHMLRSALSSQNIAVALLSAFGVLALLLAAIGLYGVMSYSVTQSKRELGLRMALGASVTNVLKLVMSHGLALTAVGILIGAVAALGLTRLIASLLYNVSPANLVAFGSAFLVMIIAGLAACFFPAWRATRIDPVRVLRD